MFTGSQGAPLGFLLQITLWLWFTVLFANFAEAMAEGRGKAQADSLRKARTQTFAQARQRRLNREGVGRALRKGDLSSSKPATSSPATAKSSKAWRRSTNPPSPANPRRSVRESGRRPQRRHRRHARAVRRDQIRITSNPGETFLDRMIGLVEGAKRQKTPNEIALTILLSALTIIFLVVLIALKAVRRSISDVDFSDRPVLVALLVCLIPTTIGGLLSAIGIAGMDRLVQKNVIAMCGRAVEAAGDVDVLLLDKTGTITLGNRQAAAFLPAPRRDRAGAGRRRPTRVAGRRNPRRPQHRRAGQGKIRIARARVHDMPHATFVPFTAQTRMSGVDLDGRSYRKGAAEAIRTMTPAASCPRRSRRIVESISEMGATPLVVANQRQECSARSSSKTLSRAASRTASSVSARWASARS